MDHAVGSFFTQAVSFTPSHLYPSGAWPLGMPIEASYMPWEAPGSHFRISIFPDSWWYQKWLLHHPPPQWAMSSLSPYTVVTARWRRNPSIRIMPSSRVRIWSPGKLLTELHRSTMSLKVPVGQLLSSSKGFGMYEAGSVPRQL